MSFEPAACSAAFCCPRGMLLLSRDPIPQRGHDEMVRHCSSLFPFLKSSWRNFEFQCSLRLRKFVTLPPMAQRNGQFASFSFHFELRARSQNNRTIDLIMAMAYVSHVCHPMARTYFK